MWVVGTSPNGRNMPSGLAPYLHMTNPRLSVSIRGSFLLFGNQRKFIRKQRHIHPDRMTLNHKQIRSKPSPPKYRHAKHFEDQIRQIENILDTHLPSADTMPSSLHAAMRYSVFAGGKRLRPLLCLAAAKAAGGDEASALLPAAALEILHTYTLIHDDLPGMDNDTMRRGKPTLHVVYGETIAILAGDALLTMAFEWLAETVAPPPYHPNQLSLELAQAAGSRGVIAGRREDIAAERQPPDPARWNSSTSIKPAT